MAGGAAGDAVASAGDAMAGTDGLLAPVRAQWPLSSLDKPGFLGSATGPWCLSFSFPGEGWCREKLNEP